MIVIAFAALNEANNFEKLIVELNNTICKYENNILEINKITHKQIDSPKLNFVICIDGSTDNSLSILQNLSKKYQITILEPQNTKGLGIAFGRIFDYFLANYQPQDLLVTLDADLTHLPEDLIKLLAKMQKTDCDLVIGSRFCQSAIISGFPLYRYIISRSVAKLLQIFTPIIGKNYGKNQINYSTINDYTSGYRIYRFNKLKELQIIIEKQQQKLLTEQHFTYTIEILLKLIYINAQIHEIGIKYCYDNKISNSKLSLIDNFTGLLKLLYRFYRNKLFTLK